MLASVQPPVPRARAVVVCMQLRPARTRRLLPAVAVVAKRIDGLAGGGGGGGLGSGSLDRLHPTRLLPQAATLAVSAGQHDCEDDCESAHAQSRQESAPQAKYEIVSDFHLETCHDLREIKYQCSMFKRNARSCTKTAATQVQYTGTWPPTPRQNPTGRASLLRCFVLYERPFSPALIYPLAIRWPLSRADGRSSGLRMV